MIEFAKGLAAFLQFKNRRRGIEGMPLKLVLIILLAVIVIAIVLQMTGVLRTGINQATGEVNSTLVREVNRSLNNVNVS